MVKSQIAQQVGRRLRELRERAGLTQHELGQRVGLKPPEISKIESGKRSPRLETLERFAGAFSVSVRDLFPVAEAEPAWWEEALALRLRGCDDTTRRRAIGLIDALLEPAKLGE